uniref:Condensation domain-containing protein n=1 Tax=Candidatus Kentrum sp. TC TaxID=2126339 RepID=A0A450YJF5_9GAMM|nr:MAG: Condensation domain-containing protein [Candidatus Kentron sp. TC]
MLPRRSLSPSNVYGSWIGTKGAAATYNIPIALRLSGDLDVDALRASLSWMVERHEALRTYFPNTEGEARAEMLSVSAFEFPIHDLRHLPPAEWQLQRRVDEHATRPFDLAQGPLFRAEILRLGEHHGQEVDVLLINMHHIIGDG